MVFVNMLTRLVTGVMLTVAHRVISSLSIVVGSGGAVSVRNRRACYRAIAVRYVT